MIRRRTKTQKTPRQTNQSQPNSSSEELTFLEHLYELRSRLFWIVASLIVTSAIAFQYKDFLVNFIMAPLDGQKLVYLTPGGGFSFIFTVCLYFGALVTIPVVMYHIYRFLQPVLGKTSRRFIVLILLLSASLATAGAVFGYMVAIPAAIHFLMEFAGDAVSPNLTAESYLGFIVAYMLGLAALFQLPLLLFMIDHVKPFPPGALLSSQRFVVVGAVIAAAIITPTPDIVNQLIVAGPIIVVYQLGAIAVFVRRHTSRRQKKQTASVQASADIQGKKVTQPSVSTPATPAATIPSASVPEKRALTAPATTVKTKSIDGFSRRPTPARSALAVPARPEQKEAPRPLKSIDGMIA